MTANAKRIFWTITISAALIGSLGLGIRQNFGLFLTDMTRDLELWHCRISFGESARLSSAPWLTNTVPAK